MSNTVVGFASDGGNMGRKTITALAILAIAIAAMQMTSLAFMGTKATHFAWGIAAGLSFGAIVTWVTSGSGKAA
jgi:hypothetical protein